MLDSANKRAYNRNYKGKRKTGRRFLLMNISKFTQKSVEAVQTTEKLAYDYGNQEIEQEHLLLALLQQQEGLIPKLIEKMEIDLTYFTNDAIQMVQNRVKVQGGQT